MTVKFVNLFKRGLGVAVLAGDTSITLATGSGALLPALSATDPMIFVIRNGTSYEIVRAIGITGEVLDVTGGRAFEDAVAHPASGWAISGTTVENCDTAGTMDGFAQKVNTLDQFADVTQTATKTLAITESTTLAGGSHSGSNTGDQTSIVGITGTTAQFNTALSDADFATGGGTVSGASSGTNTGDQFTSTTADRLLGRGNGGGAGAAQEIVLGTNLSMTGTTLNAAAGGGLTNFTESVNTTAPNATVPVVRLLATNAATHVDVAISPKGNGSIAAQVADDGTGGGTKRGALSVDLQMSRTVASDVASGAYSAIGGGQRNKASDNSTVVSGGVRNVASGYWSSVGGGYFNRSTGDRSVVGGGNQNQATGTRSACFSGTSNNCSGTEAVIGGGSSNLASATSSGVFTGGGNSATGTYSAILGGASALASRYGQESYAAGFFAVQGDNQRVDYVMRKNTTNTTPTELALDGGTARLTIASGTILSGTINMVGSKNDGTAVCAFIRQFTIKNVGGTTSLVGTVNTIGSDTASTIILAVTADDTNDSLKIEVTNANTENWRFVAHVEAVELKYV